MSNNNAARDIQIGDVYLMSFEGSGSSQTGVRPGVVFQNNLGNVHSPNVVMLPLTTARKKLGQPTHVLLAADVNGLARDSIVLCENPVCFAKESLGRYLTRLSPETMSQIAAAHLLASSAIAFLDEETLLQTWHQARSLNGGAA